METTKIGPSIVVSVVLAFVFGYSLTLIPLRPDAMDTPLSSPTFWGSLALALLLAGIAAFPVNRWLILRGQGHAVAHAHHGRHSH